MKKEIEAIFKGRVQGVNFRNQLASKALELELTGTVENLSDGSVKLIAQGNKEKLTQLVHLFLELQFPIDIVGMKFEFRDIINRYDNFIIIKNSNFIIDKIKAVKNLGKNILNINKPTHIPNHVAIIPDGNRRWARSQGLAESMGHKVGADFDRLFEIFQEAKNIGVKYLSFWAFSTENWSRDKNEISLIFQQLTKVMAKGRDVLVKEGIRFRVIGRKDRLPPQLIKGLTDLENLTRNNDELYMQLLLDYGGRDEIVRAVNKILQQEKDKEKNDDKIGEITEEGFASFLDTKGIPDPDLIIRTSGEQRLSGLLPFQSVYSEIYFTMKYFPDFGVQDFKIALEDFDNRNRRYGGSATKSKKTFTN